MALYWPQARLALEYGEVERRGQAYAAGTLVLTMRPDQVDDPEFARAIRQIVALRVGGCACEGREAAGEAAGRAGEGRPEGIPHDDLQRRSDEAERRFERNLLEEDVPDGAPGCDGTACGWDPLGFGPDEAPAAHVVIGRCGSVTVRP